jgi:hypothetical protein
MLNQASAVHDAGSATVNGQRATRFVGVVKPSELEHDTPEAVRENLPSFTLTLEVFFAANGLPLRTVLRVRFGVPTQGSRKAYHARTKSTTDITAVNFPLKIEAPASSQTIGIRKYWKIEKRLHKQESGAFQLLGADRRPSS